MSHTTLSFRITYHKTKQPTSYKKSDRVVLAISDQSRDRKGTVPLVVAAQNPSCQVPFSQLAPRPDTLSPMKLPVHDPHEPTLRAREDIRAMSIAVQANLVQLKVSESKRRRIPPEQHEIQVPSPGTVRRFRETLIDHRTLSTYSDQEVHLRLHEVWGQFCLLRWLFSASVDSEAEMHCAAALEAKHAELHALLWRIRFEQRRRDQGGIATTDQSRDRKGAVLSAGRGEGTKGHSGDEVSRPVAPSPVRPSAPPPLFPDTSHKRKRVVLSSVSEDRFLTGAALKRALQREELVAAQIPAIVFGKTMEQATDEELLLGACQHAGMLAALRWTLDPHRPWADPGIMDVNEDPFSP